MAISTAAEEERILTQAAQDGDGWQQSLRPRRFAEYIGQDKVKKIWGFLCRRR